MCFLCLVVALSVVGWWHEAGAVFVVASFPDRDDFFDRDVAILTAIVAKMQHTCLYLEYVSSKTRCTAAVKIDFLADEFR